MRRAACMLGLFGTLLAAPLAAQAVSPQEPIVLGVVQTPPGPRVFDVRGAMSGIPSSALVYPTLPTHTPVPARGFGLDLGFHRYGRRVGQARLGLGANLIAVRGSVPASVAASTSTSVAAAVSSGGGPQPAVSATLVTLAPQVSLNFGTGDGWSHLSAGYGVAHVGSVVAGGQGQGSRATGTFAGSVNVGGGARWFVSPRMAVGFDLRLHILAGSGLGTPLSATVGLSLR